MKFVTVMSGFIQKTSVLNIKYFDKKKFILKGKRNKLNWDLHPIPTIHSEKIRKLSFFADNNRIFEKPPKLRRTIHQPDELQDFLSADTRKDLNHLEEEKFCVNSFWI